MLKFEDEQIKQYESDLKTFAKQAYPFATKATINTAAFETRKESQKRIREQFVNRNKFTASSVRVKQAKGLNVRTQEAIVGSIADYLETQEFGGTERGRGASQPIATSYAAGQSEGARPRTRLPRRPNQLKNIRLANTRKPASRKARNAAAVQQAAETGQRYVYLDLGRRKGLFKITGGKRRPQVKMIWDLTRRSVRVPRSPWLKPSVDAVAPRLPQYYRKALEFQLQRRGILGR